MKKHENHENLRNLVDNHENNEHYKNKSECELLKQLKCINSIWELRNHENLKKTNYMIIIEKMKIV